MIFRKKSKTTAKKLSENVTKSTEALTHEQHLAKVRENEKKGLPLLNHLSNKRKIIIMLAVMSATFLVSLDQTIVSTALGHIVEDFHSFSKMSWVVTAYLLTITAAIPIAGKLSDLFGRKVMVLLGLVIFVIGSLGSGSSSNIEWLIIYRAIQGLGAGVIMANSFTIIGDLFTPRERGRWQGLISSVFALAAVAGPLIGGFLADGDKFLNIVTSWRWNFWLNVPIGIAAFILILVFCPMIKHAAKAKIDYLGALCITVALSAIVLATDSTSTIFAGLINHGINIAVIEGILWSLAVVAIVGFIIVEKFARAPIIPLRFFANRTFAFAMAASLFFGAAFMSVILYITQFNQQVFGADATKSGLMLLPAVLSMSITAALTGAIVTKTGRYKTQMTIGFIMVTIACAWATTMNADSSYLREALIMIVAGIGLGQAMPTLNLCVQNAFHQKDIGVATASSQLFRSLGQTVGTAILGSMLTAGVALSLGVVAKIPFIDMIANSPAAKEIVDGQKIDADFAMSLNTPDLLKQIKSGFATELATQSAIAKQMAITKITTTAAQLPIDQRETFITNQTAVATTKIEQQVKQAQQTFNDNKTAFANQVVDAFVKQLRTIFWWVTAMAAAGTLLVMFGIKEHRLRGTTVGEPGVVE